MKAKVLFRMKDRSEYTFTVEGDEQNEIFKIAREQLNYKLNSIACTVIETNRSTGWNLIESWQTTRLDVTDTPAEDKTDGIAARSPLQKIRFDLLPIAPIVEVAKVFTFGAWQYGDRNWEAGFSWSRCIGAAWRHFTKWLLGEEYDDESGLHHLAHAIANLLFLLQYVITGKGVDDRQKASPAFIAQLFEPINIDTVQKESNKDNRCTCEKPERCTGQCFGIAWKEKGDKQ